MGTTANIIDLWESFRAAKMALNNTLEIENVQCISNNYNQKLKVLM